MLGIVVSVGGVFTVVVVGGLYIAGIFKKAKDEEEEKENKEEDRLIDILQKTVDTLKDQVGTQKKAHDEQITQLQKDVSGLTHQINALKVENQTLIKVLQGRDEKMQKFYENGLIAFGRIEQIHRQLPALK